MSTVILFSGLRRKIILPVIVIFVILLGVQIYAANQMQNTQWNLERAQLHAQLERQFDNQIRLQVKLMSSIQEIIEHDHAIVDAMVVQDRDLLYRLTASIYKEVNHNHNITHFYFTNPDRVNLLRVHQPDRYGDVINRHSMLQTVKQGKAQWGLSIGPLGTYTLRLVRPLLSDGHEGDLVGYIELGMEVEHVLRSIAENLGIDLVLLLEKSAVERAVWERGLKRLVREGDWGQFRDHVVIYTTRNHTVAELAEEVDLQAGGMRELLRQDQQLHYDGEEILNFVRILINSEQTGRNGYLLGVQDATSSKVQIDQQVARLFWAGLLLTVPLLLVLYLFLGKLERWYEQRNREVIQAKDDFIASMSHELRTPLTTIIGNCEFLAELEREPEKQRLIRTIEVSGRSQLSLVNDILDMSKIESGKFNINKVAFNLNVLLTDIERMFTVKMRDKGLDFDIEQEHSFSHKMVGDGQRIGQVLINLLGNAVKFTDRGKVTLRAWREEEQLIFLVEDTGIGITPEVKQRLFQRFEQADGSISRRFGGTGLGLYISRILVELMGGEISVESSEGEGSRFLVRLPYEEGAPIVSKSRSDERRSSVLMEQFQGRVLVAEDTPELQLLVRKILESQGLEVILAGNGQEAVDQVLSQSPDLVMMDMQMPIMSGIEATEILRNQGVTIPIIALTANVMQKHKDAFEQAGCDDFLEKPINRGDLVAVLKHYLKAPTSQSDHSELIDEELMALFIDSATKNRDKLTAAFRNGELSEVRAIAHTIKGSAASFGYTGLATAAEALQLALDEGETEVESLVTVVQREFERVLG